ncbi:MAG: ribonuclease Y [Limisphaerales bacterium]
MFSTSDIWIGAAGFALGVGLALGLARWRQRQRLARQQREAEELKARLHAEAEQKALAARQAAQEEVARQNRETEQSLAAQRAQLVENERRLAEREGLLNAQLERLLRTERELENRQAALQTQQADNARRAEELAALIHQRRQQLQSLAGISPAAARQQFLKEIEEESLRDASKIARRIVDEARTRAEDKARQILCTAIQRYASEHTGETSTATIALADTELKGRIIGREGRNIRAFESATGVTVLVDDTPNAVVLSSFDPVRREIAREAMSRLIQDGRIHPTRIEEVVAKVTQEMEESIVRLGEEAATRAAVAPLASEVARLLGRLHFRRSYAQNLLDHSVEVAHLAGLMAAELGLDAATARRAGLLHDIGKALNHEVEGPHAVVGADFLRRHGEPEPVVNGVAAHHHDVEPVGPWALLVSAADAISASRPGARSESMTTYIKRVEDLERIGMSFPGVEKAYAVQAGRELRVFVQPTALNDDQAFGLARSIAQKIEGELQYPGQIKVTVIRETRCVEVAK